MSISRTLSSSPIRMDCKPSQSTGGACPGRSALLITPSEPWLLAKEWKSMWSPHTSRVGAALTPESKGTVRKKDALQVTAWLSRDCLLDAISPPIFSLEGLWPRLDLSWCRKPSSLERMWVRIIVPRDTLRMISV